MYTATQGQVRLLLADLLQVIEKTSRAYQSIVLHAPGAARGAAVEGWPELCQAANETAARAERILERFELDEVAPPSFLAQELADRLRARRALSQAAPRRPEMRVH